MEIKYQIANVNDLDEIYNLVKSAIDSMIKQNIFQWDDLYPNMDDFRQDINKNQLHIGLVDNRAVIYVLNQECDNEYKNGNWKYKHQPFYIIHRLCVHPIFQNQGITKTTLMHIEEEVRALGIHSIRLNVFSENPFALKLYHHYGYSKTGDVNWRKGKFYLMEKHF